MIRLSAIARRLLCRHEFVERGTFKRDAWWSVSVCEKCSKIRRERALPMPTLVYRDEERTTELTIDQLRKLLRQDDT
jgi:hypothetical protein